MDMITNLWHKMHTPKMGQKLKNINNLGNYTSMDVHI